MSEQPDLWSNQTIAGKQQTSRDAAQKALGTSGSKRRQVFNLLAQRGRLGASDAELQQILEMKESTERPRRLELQHLGLIEDSGVRRNGFTVWRLTEQGHNTYFSQEDVA